MIEHAFDTLTRSLGRRGAVQALTAAAAMTLSGAALAGAKSNNGNNNKKNKKQKKKIEKQALALCAGQVTQCQALVEGDSDQLICCQELADCDFGALVACLNTPAEN